MYTITGKRDMSAELIEGLEALNSEHAGKLDLQSGCVHCHAT